MKNQKPINSYDRVLREVLKEAAGTGGPASTIGIAPKTPGGGTPHLGASMTGPSGYDIPEIQRQERAEHMAPPLLPFPLDAAWEHVTGAIFEMDKLKTQIKIATENNTIMTDTTVNKMKQIHEYLAITIDKFVKIGKIIETANLNDNL